MSDDDDVICLDSDNDNSNSRPFLCSSSSVDRRDKRLLSSDDEDLPDIDIDESPKSGLILKDSNTSITNKANLYSSKENEDFRNFSSQSSAGSTMLSSSSSYTTEFSSLGLNNNGKRDKDNGQGKKKLKQLDSKKAERYHKSRIMTNHNDEDVICLTENSCSNNPSQGLKIQDSVDKKKRDKTKADIEKLRKAKEKELKKAEELKIKELKKAEDLKAKELRKATCEVQRSYKPGESIKHMTVILDSRLSRFDFVVPQLAAAEIRSQTDPESVVENSVRFSREIMKQGMTDDLQVKLISSCIEEEEIVVIVESEEFIPMVDALLNKSEDALDLISWTVSVMDSYPKKKLTLVLYNFEKYFRKLVKNTQQDYRNRVLNTDDATQPPGRRKKQKNSVPVISRMELQSALLEVQLQTGINYRMVKNEAELSSLIIHYTKAIADRPFKQQRLEAHGFDWFALSNSVGSVKVEKDWAGLRKLWIDQLLQFNGINIDLATAIATKYPSPKVLLEAYDACNNEKEGQELLQDITATSGIGPLARTRKVGVDTSKKMHRFFTSNNGERFLGSSQDTR